MRQVVARIVTLLLITPFVFASEVLPPSELQWVLDKIDFQVSAKQWVTTESALLGVTINVTLSSADLVKARTEIMNRLNKIAQSDWHLINFDRSQDNSGLEKLYVQAQARVNQAALTDVYKNAKSVSLPGAKYEISSIDFKPSFEEKQAVLSQIRQHLYQQVDEELARINKLYPAQKYSVSNLLFVEDNNPALQQKNNQAKEMNPVAFSATVLSPALTVSNELIVTAVVEVASNRKR